MKKITYLLCSCIVLHSCIKKEYITPSATSSNTANSRAATAFVDSKTIALTSDTTITGVWDGGGKVIQIYNYTVHGTGTFQNWIIDAAYTQQIFDSSLNLANIQVAGDRFSTAWYGANPANADNWWNIQKSVNVCIANNLPCYTPAGTYKHSHLIDIYTIYKGAYSQTKLHFFGDDSYWDTGSGTVFQNTSSTSGGINLQLNKGSEIDHIGLYGLRKSPTGLPDSVYYNLTLSKFTDASGLNIQDTYWGLSIDGHAPLDGANINGSTGCHIHDISIGNYSIGMIFSANNITSNCDVMRVENYHGGDNKVMFAGCQSQEKDNIFSGMYCWGNTAQIVSIGNYFKGQAGQYDFNGANIAGHVIMPFYLNVGSWYSSSFENWYTESIGYIGTFSTNIPVTITNSTFNMVCDMNKKRNVVTSNSAAVSFNNCTIRYYDGTNSNVYWTGSGTFTNCYYGGGSMIRQ